MTGGTTTAVVQARSTSQRLPNKVLATIAGRTVLEWVVSACERSDAITAVVVTAPSGDTAVIDEATRLGIRVATGPEADLITRFQRAAAAVDTASIVRVTADCPLLDPALLTAAIRRFVAQELEYQDARAFPRGLADNEVIDVAALLAIDSLTATEWEREHVGPWFVNRADELRIAFFEPEGPLRRPDLRLCVDEAADLELVRLVAERLGDQPAALDVIHLLDSDPSLKAINRNVRQRS